MMTFLAALKTRMAMAGVAGSLPILLVACGPWGPKPSTGGAGAVNPSDTARPAALRHAPPDPAPMDAGAGLPFPDVKDSMRFDVPVSETVRAYFRANPSDTHYVRSGETQGPALGRPDRPRREGIRIKPRPANLPAFARVLISRGSKPVNLYSLGEIEIRDDGASGKKPKVVRGRLAVRREGGGFILAQGGRTLAEIPAKRLRLVSQNPYNLLELGGQVYRGHMEIVAAASGELLAVNVVGVEDYLRGVLPYELGKVDREALEALKAQAVAARTYALKRMMANPGGDFHLHSSVQDQVYRGVKGEYLLSDRAIRETRGMALSFRDTLALCFYHSTCGGRTASRHEVWNGDSLAYLVSRPDLDPEGNTWCAASKYSEWRQEWTLTRLAGILKRNLPSAGVPYPPAFTKVSRLEIEGRASCGRIKVLRIVTDKGDILVKGDKVRWALRPADAEERILPSAWFEVKVTGDKALAEGRAFGHGIGLCQVGTIARAKAGQDFRQIMAAYYAGTELVEFR